MFQKDWEKLYLIYVFHQVKAIEPDGNCRACMVEIEGERVLAASCIRKPSENMKVFSNSSKAIKSRSLVLELLDPTNLKKIVIIQTVILIILIKKLKLMKIGLQQNLYLNQTHLTLQLL